MKRYLVSVSKEVCTDFVVEAETAQEANAKALTGFLSDFSQYSDDWCEGHEGTLKVGVVEELDD
jgi:hypothetical protein